MSPFRDEHPFRHALCILAAAAMAACGGGTGSAEPSDAGVEDAGAFDQAEADRQSDLDLDEQALKTIADTGDDPEPVAVAGITVTAPGAPAEPTPTTLPLASTDALAVSIDTALVPLGATGHLTERIKPTTQATNSASIGAFRTTCAYSHMAKDDPIVFPNQPGRSHLHTFFGNTGANAHSTPQSIANSGNSTCHGGTANRSAYWVPSMIDTRNGSPIKPWGSMIYYKTGYNGILPSQVRPFPAGLRMIAGNAKNTLPSGPFRYLCHGKDVSHLWGPGIQNCPVGTQLWQVITFPQCWDGVNLDSPDHKSHMSYTVKRPDLPASQMRYGRWCPASHPIALPEITFNIRYAVTEANAPLHWRLSSDAYDRTLPGGYSAHGDWVNGWKPEVLKAFV